LIGIKVCSCASMWCVCCCGTAPNSNLHMFLVPNSKKKMHQ
jgi:hypothetical protein